MPDPLRLRTAIGPYPHVHALRDGSVGSSRVTLEFVEVAPITRAFRRMARDMEFDLCEMAADNPRAGAARTASRSPHCRPW